MSSDGEGFMEAYSSVGRSSGFTEETLNLWMTAKQPPLYDGKVSWTRYEELVDDGVTFTTMEASKRRLKRARKYAEEVLPEGLDERVLIQTSITEGRTTSSS